MAVVCFCNKPLPPTFIHLLLHTMTGTIKFFNTEKGFGFVVPDDGSQDMFFHVSQCVEGWEPAEGEQVSYEVGSGRDGRPAASNVQPAGGSDSYEEEYAEEGQEEEVE